MGNLALASMSISDAAVVTAGNEIVSMPVTNLQHDQPTYLWRTSGLSNLYVVIDLGSAIAINLISLLYHNCTSAATWRVRAATSQANLTASPGYDSTAVNMWDAGWPSDQSPVHAIRWFGTSTKTFRWWRIDISDAANPAGYIQAGRLCIDSAYQLPTYKNISLNWGLQHNDPSPASRSKGAQLYTEELASWRSMQASIDWLTETEMYSYLYEVQRRLGRKRPLLVLRDPDATTHLLRQTLYGKMEQLAPIMHAQQQIFRTRLMVEEML